VGEPGIGKTRTATVLAEHARDHGIRVLWGRCHEGAGAPSFWPWVEVLRDCVTGVGDTELEPWAPVLAELVPEVRARFPALPVAAELEPAQARFRLFDCAARVLTGPAARNGLLLVLDDLHWADRASLLLLEHLAARVSRARALVLGTFRDTELWPGHPLPPALGELERVAAVERIALTGLSEADVSRFIVAGHGERLPAEQVAAIHARTDGNPFFVRELVRLLAAEGDDAAVPPVVRDVIRRHAARLPDDCAALLTDAAVLGREFSLEAVARMARIAPAAVIAALDEAERAGLVVPLGRVRFRFVHALVREALYAELGPAARRRAHRRAGEALEAQADPPLAQLAHHFTQAAPDGDVDRAVTYATKAAEHDLQMLAYEAAAEHYRLAFDAAALRPRHDPAECRELLLGTGDAQSRAGDTAAARNTFAQAAALARAAEDAQRFGRAALGFAGTVVVARGAADPATIALLDEALAACGTREDLLACRLQSRLAMELVWDPARQGERQTVSASAVALARRLEHARAIAEALVARHYAIWAPETAAERLPLAKEIVALADSRGDGELGLRGRRWLIADLLEHGERAEADRELAALARRAEELRQPLYHWVADGFGAVFALLDGDLERAEAHAQTALAPGRRALGELADVYHAAWTIGVLRERDRIDEAEAAAARTAARFPALAIFACYRAQLLAELGEQPRAAELLETLVHEDGAALPRDALWLGAVAALAETCCVLEATGQARTLYRAAAPFTELVVMPAALPCAGSAQRTLGLLACTAGRRDSAHAHYAAAMASDARMGARVWVAWTRHELASLLGGGTQPADRSRALELNGAALDAAGALGLEQLRRRALALDGRLRRTRPAGLSRREAEVLALVGDGRSNKEIAAELVVTDNTVERHLVSIYRKIGARRRADAAVFAHAHGVLAGNGKDSGFP
jgi:DNA-binding CsgD family transcriptional regulator